MATQVIPGQPLSVAGTSASLAAGPGTFVRGGKVYAALVGQVKREGGVRPSYSVLRKPRAQADVWRANRTGPVRPGQGGDAGDPRTECHSQCRYLTSHSFRRRTYSRPVGRRWSEQSRASPGKRRRCLS